MTLYLWLVPAAVRLGLAMLTARGHHLAGVLPVTASPGAVAVAFAWPLSAMRQAAAR